MTKLPFQNIALSWYQGNPIRHSGALADNSLFRMLYDAYCRSSGSKIPFADIARNGDYAKACSDLFSWYESRYAITFGMKSGTQGQKRTVTHSSTDYSFDLLYGDDRQFKSYLLTPLPQSGSQDLFSFVLHTAVAFMVSPLTLDAVLQQLGFHPLHVRNIHHLAIYSVLLSTENQIPAPDFNPFARVRELYSSGCALLDTPGTAVEVGFRYADQQTRAIRDALFVKKALESQNFEALVSMNQNELTMRHSLILEDFHKLSGVFLNIYDCAEADPAFPSDPRYENHYSFYAFVERYCKENLKRRKFREQLTSMIDNNGKHPTRNVLILLWLYAYCFSFTPGVFLEKTVFTKIEKQIRKNHPALAAQAKHYYQHNIFDVYGFIIGSRQRELPEVFDGADFIADINEKLLLRYGWGQLNAKLPFDYYILKLKDLEIRMDPFREAGRCEGIFYGSAKLADKYDWPDNVPCPLAVITDLLSQLKTVLANLPYRSFREEAGDCPLKTALYEQI
jgi:hypothetical protein